MDSVEMKRHIWWQNLACCYISRCRWHHMQWVSSHLADVCSCLKAEKKLTYLIHIWAAVCLRKKYICLLFRFADVTCHFEVCCYCWREKRGKKPPYMIHVFIDSRTKMKGQTFIHILYSIHKHLQRTGWLMLLTVCFSTQHHCFCSESPLI